ncbi:MAG: TldD/PmbA family protein [Candidatus Njordarchaeia archaeon]
MINELMEISEKFVRDPKKYGANELEIFIQRSENINIRNIQGFITTKAGVDAGVAIRAVVDKSLGFVAISSIDEDSIEKAIKEAVKIARVKPADPDFRGLADPVNISSSSGIYDEELAQLEIEKIAEISNKLERDAREESECIKKIDLSISRSIEYVAIANSRGILNGDKGTFFSVYIDVKSRKGDEETSGLEYVVDRKFPEEILENMGKGAARRALKMLGAEKLSESFKGDLLVENILVYDLLIPLEYNISALNVQQNRSVWKEKLGEEVANKKMTIVDDGQEKEGYLTMKMDGEGVPMQRKVLIQNGVLKNFIYDTYAAKRVDKVSTGNAFRRSYMSPPSLSCTNIIIPPGNKSLDDLIQNVDKGVYATTFLMGSHMTNPIKGFFSLTSINSFYIENGEIKHPIKSVNISGNFFEAIKNIKEIGSDVRKHYKGFFPSVIIEGISFV